MSKPRRIKLKTHPYSGDVTREAVGGGGATGYTPLPKLDYTKPPMGSAMRPRIHVIGLPHTIATEEFSHCAFTGKLQRFAEVAHAAGYLVTEYSNGESASAADTKVQIFTRQDLDEQFGDRLLTETTSGPNGATHQDAENTQAFFTLAKRQLRRRIQPGDLVAHIMVPRPDFIREFSQNAHVETGIGYANEPWGAYRIFESETWRSWHMGRHSAIHGGGIGTEHGDPYPHYAALTTTAVVPNYYREEDWASAAEDLGSKRRYCMFVGRMASIKGIEIVNALAHRNPEIDFRIVSGEPKSDRFDAPNIVWLGRVSDRRTLSREYAGAVCTLIPSMFHEPFGGVCAESLLSGTPVIASNFAAFVEHVGPEDGILASGLEEFSAALTMLLKRPIESAAWRLARRSNAVARWGIEAVGKQYAAAFAAIRRNWELGILPERHPGKG